HRCGHDPGDLWFFGRDDHDFRVGSVLMWRFYTSTGAVKDSTGCIVTTLGAGTYNNYTLLTGVKMYRIVVIGSGGGGAGGPSSVNTAKAGGGGGGGGAVSVGDFPGASMPAQVNIFVAAGGSGGPGASAGAGAAGTAGSRGDTSYIIGIDNIVGPYLSAG